MNAIKPGVKIYGIRPEMVVVDSIVRSIYNDHKFGCVITSGVGKKHSEFSLHYPGFANDYRTKHIPIEAKYAIIADIRKALPCCDVVFEHEGKAQEHLHVEFDPKDDENFRAAKMIYKTTGHWPN